MEEIEALVILKHFPSLKANQIRALVERFGSACNVLAAHPEAFSQIPGIKENTIAHVGKWKEDIYWKTDLGLIEKHHVQIIPYWHEKYPSSLRELPDHPPFLYVMGDLLPGDEQAIGIVGTRICTLYGREMTEKIACDLAGWGFTVISGLARGIDTHGHLGALKAGRTIAVIGSGLSQIYPRENTNLAASISKQGAVISEFPMNALPAKHHFPIRNRLVSALSKGVFLAEAPLKSGAMITMRLASSSKKPCFALPGRADMESFGGNHELIKTQKAYLVENAFEMVSVLKGKETAVCQPSLFSLSNDADLDEDELKLIKIFPAHEMGLEELSLLSKLPIAKLSALLMGLVLKRKIREFPGKVYKKVQ